MAINFRDIIRDFLRALFKKPGSDWYPITIQVLNDLGEPVHNAYIIMRGELVNDVYTGFTNEQGELRVPNVHVRVNKATLTISHPEHNLHVAVVNVHKGVTNINIRIAQIPAEPEPEPLSPIHINNRRIIPFWRGTTSFRLLEKFIKEEDIESLLKQYRDLGFNGVRVLSTCKNMFDLPPQVGVEALDRFLSYMKEQRFYVYVDAIIDSESRQYNHLKHAYDVAAICEKHNHVLYGLANEPWHPTQHEDLHDMDFVQDLFSAVRATHPKIIGTAGPDFTDESLTLKGDFITRHLDRGRDKFDMVRRVREFEWLSGELNLAPLNNEPIGFAEASIRGKRLADPEIAYIFGVLSRIFDAPMTFHCDDGLHSNFFQPKQFEAAAKFNLGLDTWDDSKLTYKNSNLHGGWDTSPNKSFENAVRCYSGIQGNQGIMIIFGIEGPTNLQMQGGWHIDSTLYDSPTTKAYRVSR